MSSCTEPTRIEAWHNPNEGRNIINSNFTGISNCISEISGATFSGNTIVSGGAYIDVESTTGTPTTYTVSLAESISASTISGGTIYSGNTELTDIFAQVSDVDNNWTSGSTGNYSIKANNDSGLDATADYSVAEGNNTLASGSSSHAEGNLTVAGGVNSHAEGQNTTATGVASHSEGNNTNATGNYSHAGGTNTRTLSDNTFIHSNNSNILSGATNSVILGGSGNTIDTNVLRSVILGGSNITGTTDDTVYGVNADFSNSISATTYYGDGSQLTGISQPTLTKTMTVELPLDSDNITLFRAEVPSTIQSANAVVFSGTSPDCNVRISKNLDRSSSGTTVVESVSITGQTSGQTLTVITTGDANKIATGEWVWVTFPTVTSVPNYITIDVRYTED